MKKSILRSCFVASCFAATASFGATISVEVSTTGGIVPCSNFDSAGGAAVSASCVGEITLPTLTASGNATANATFGSIGVGVVSAGNSEAADENNPRGAVGINSVASARISDSAQFNIDSGFFQIPLDIAGSLQFLKTADGPGEGVSRLTVSLFARAFNSFDLAFFYDAFENGFPLSFVQVTQVGELGIYNHRVPIINGFASFGADWTASATCALFNDVPRNCLASAAFTQSARFLAATVFDDAGNVRNDAYLGSSSGFNYLVGVEPHVSPVPLPASLLFLSAGLAGLGFFGRRAQTRSNVS